jgi:hypothetical protein
MGDFRSRVEADGTVRFKPLTKEQPHEKVGEMRVQDVGLGPN